MKSIFKVFFIALLAGAFATQALNTLAVFTKTVSATTYRYLVAGLDDAADNTDVLVMVSYDSVSNESSVLQIPRDTYCNFDGYQNKINQLYSHFRRKEDSPQVAMKKTADFIGQIFSISFDGYVAMTTKSFREAVDSIGGVLINLPMDFVYESKRPGESFVLKRGQNLLDGKKAEVFIRHRKSYAMGDLGRIDAQKIFFGGLYKTFTEHIGFDKLVKLAFSLDKGVVTDFSFTETATAFIKNFSRLKQAGITYVTVPGAPFLHSSGTSYYVLNKKACERLSSERLFSSDTFDRNKICTNPAEAEIEEIYYRENITYREYKQGDIDDIIIARSMKGQ